MRGTEEARKLRKGKCAYNPWTHISHKELIYLLQKFISPRSKVLLRMLLGGRLVGVNHRAPPTFTQRWQSRINCAPTSRHNERLYVHASGITNLNTNILTRAQLLINITHISHHHISKLLLRIKFILPNDLHDILFSLSFLDIYHFGTNFHVLLFISSNKYK